MIKIDLLYDELDELKAYKEAYHILMGYWECLPDEEKPHINKQLKELGL